MLVLLDENLLSRKLKPPIIDAGHSVFNVDMPTLIAGSITTIDENLQVTEFQP
jgi:hypothetical protein